MGDVVAVPGGEFAAILARLDDLARAVRRLEVGRVDDAALLKIGVVCELTTLSEREVYRRVKAGTFPRPKVLSDGRRGWEKRKVVQWIRHQPDAPG